MDMNVNESAEDKQDLIDNSLFEFKTPKPSYLNTVMLTSTTQCPGLPNLYDGSILSYTPILDLLYLHDHYNFTPPNLGSSPSSSLLFIHRTSRSPLHSRLISLSTTLHSTLTLSPFPITDYQHIHRILHTLRKILYVFLLEAIHIPP
ncbi:hypothetical protein GYMLUDRAFT_915040 [Collybiopsis luxurians FD-317 M1]|nr:hypothetical protein GYMLUDRAFT_915040 [Collybiopsis luxurians FD-317 M1]